MTENMLDDPKDQEIMRHLLENPEGLKRTDLRKKTLELCAKRTFDMHLEYLIKNDYVKRLKDPSKGKNSTTILKPNISDERIGQIKHLLQHLVSLQLIYKSKLPKKTKIEVTSHALKELSFSYGELVNEYINWYEKSRK